MGRRKTMGCGVRNPSTKGQQIIEFKPPRSPHQEVIREFLALVDAENMMLAGFDWQAWSSTDEAQQLCSGGKWVARASRVQLSKMITLQVRKGCFVAGSLQEAAQSGLLAAIASRLRSLNHND